MKKIFIVVSILCIILSITSCKNTNNNSTDNDTSIDNSTDNSTEIDYSNITFVDTNLLYKGMPRKDVVDKFGEPIDNIGSGVAILLYMADEGEMIVLYFDLKDKLHKAELVDTNDNTEEVKLKE
jgi:hypothetical protein